MRVGNLAARRDFCDVRDVVRAYWLALEHGRPGEVYNICSGASVAIQELLDQLLALSETPVTIEQDPARMRPSDVPDMYGSAALLWQQTGWQPTIALERSLRDTLAYWRGIVAATA
jgi:GDP-4-dehydro-6-deoxy-D-mannose reductase